MSATRTSSSRRILGPTLVGVAMLALSVGPGAGVALGADSAEAIDPCMTPVVAVSGTIIWLNEEPGTKTYVTDVGTHTRDFIFNSVWDADDDRLDGDQRFEAEWDFGLDGGINRGTIYIDNAAGERTWEGPWRGVGPENGDWQAFVTLTGRGSYEGISADLFATSGNTGSLSGSIYPTDIASCDFATM